MNVLYYYQRDVLFGIAVLPLFLSYEKSLFNLINFVLFSGEALRNGKTLFETMILFCR